MDKPESVAQDENSGGRLGRLFGRYVRNDTHLVSRRHGWFACRFSRRSGSGDVHYQMRFHLGQYWGR